MTDRAAVAQEIQFYRGIQMTKPTLLLLLLFCISSAGAIGQINCNNGSPSANKLVCQIPFSTGVYNLNGIGNSQTTQQAIKQAQTIATTFNSAIATQVSQLPLSSASSGTVVIYSAGIPETYNNLGPILTDRAETVGRHKLFLGFTASQFYFTDINGISLRNVTIGYQLDVNANSNTYTVASTNIHFKINQYVAVATLGLTNKLDVSIIVPSERVSVGTSTSGAEQYILNASNQYTGLTSPLKSGNSTGIASGIGDIAFNGKYELWRGGGEHATLSAGMNLRTPTGDDKNYLGSGAWGFNPYLVFSYLHRLSPHAKIGYQWNTATELNNPTSSPGGNLALPGGLQYDIGADWRWTKQLTVAGDILGSQYLNTPKFVAGTQEFPIAAAPSTEQSLPSLTPVNSSYTVGDLSAGLKWNPYRNLVIAGNVLIQLNNVGLRTRPAPLVGISYKF
jgi:hypothetical protein